MMRDPLDMSVVKYLTSCQWDDRPVIAGSPPDDIPDGLVTVDRTGGSRTLTGETCLLSVWCWASTRAKAARLADMTARMLEDMPQSVPGCARCDVQAVARLPYPGPPWRERYTLTVQATWDAA